MRLGFFISFYLCRGKPAPDKQGREEEDLKMILQSDEDMVR